jgi:hypothetical protein
MFPHMHRLYFDHVHLPISLSYLPSFHFPCLSFFNSEDIFYKRFLWPFHHPMKIIEELCAVEFAVLKSDLMVSYYVLPNI